MQDPTLSDDTKKKIKETLKKYAIPSDLHGFMRIFANWGVIFLCSLTYFLLPHIHNWFLTGIVYMIAICIIAGRQRGLEACMHEATHNTLFKTKPWNTKMQFLYAWPLFSSVEGYRTEHLVHHFKFGTEIDPALVYYQDLGIDQLSKCSTGQFYWRLLIKPFIGFSTWWHIRYTIYDHFKMQPSTILPLALFWGPILIIATLLGALKWLILFYLIPYFVLFTIIMHFSEVEDHASLYFNPTLASTRNNIGSIIHSFFLHAHDDGYHLVHHLNPKIPAHLLKKAHEECMKIPEFRDLAVNAHSFKETVHQIRRPKKIPAV